MGEVGSDRHSTFDPGPLSSSGALPSRPPETLAIASCPTDHPRSPRSCPRTSRSTHLRTPELPADVDRPRTAHRVSGQTRRVIDLLAADMDLRPDLFRWRSAIPADDLRGCWILDARLCVVPELASLWSVTGGGDLFETEDLLDPLDVNDFRVVRRTKDLAQVVPVGSTVFHEGSWLTVITADGRIVAVDRASGRTGRWYESLDDWYLDLRSEFAERYGLPPNDGNG